MKKIDTFFEKLRNIDKEFKECFAEARKYFDALNDNGLKGFTFFINCYEGKVDNITVLPLTSKEGYKRLYIGNILKATFKNENNSYALIAQVTTISKKKIINENNKEFEEYEEYCYKRFIKLESASNYDAYTPAVSMDVPDSWRETLSEQAKIDNDPDYISANIQCKDVLDRIAKTIVEPEE